MNENIQKAINRIEASLNSTKLHLHLFGLTDEDLIYILNIKKYKDFFANLKGLDLYGNNLTTLPEKIFDKLINLEWLDLSFNNLKNLPEKIFDKLVQLERLDLRRNKLKSLPEKIKNKQGLRINI